MRGKRRHGGQLRLEHLRSKPLEDLSLAGPTVVARGADRNSHGKRAIHHWKQRTCKEFFFVVLAVVCFLVKREKPAESGDFY